MLDNVLPYVFELIIVQYMQETLVESGQIAQHVLVRAGSGESTPDREEGAEGLT